MQQTVYVKFNNLRHPDFAVKTSILENNGQKLVIKSSISDEGKKHILDFPKKAEALKKLYSNNVNVLDVKIENDQAVFPFVTGQTVAGLIEESLNDFPTAMEKITHYLDLIESYSDDSITDFEISDEYRRVFGDTDYNGSALSIANIDEIFDNFLITDQGLTLIDYEWVFLFSVPKRFIRFRTVYYFLVKNYSIITKNISEKDFLKHFGFDQDEAAIWKSAEDNFQQYAHGKLRKYMYTPGYMRDVYDINDMLNNISNIGKVYSDTVEENRYIHSVIARQANNLKPQNYPKYLYKKIIKKLQKKIQKKSGDKS